MIIIHVIQKYDEILNQATIIDQFFFSEGGGVSDIFVCGRGGWVRDIHLITLIVIKYVNHRLPILKMSS